jgi:hypothetical protein
MPFRELWAFLWGYAPTWRQEVAFYLIPERWGRSPEEKERRSRKGIATSAHRAAQPREKHSSKIRVDTNGASPRYPKRITTKRA